MFALVGGEVEGIGLVKVGQCVAGVSAGPVYLGFVEDVVFLGCASEAYVLEAVMGGGEGGCGDGDAVGALPLSVLRGDSVGLGLAEVARGAAGGLYGGAFGQGEFGGEGGAFGVSLDVEGDGIDACAVGQVDGVAEDGFAVHDVAGQGDGFDVCLGVEGFVLDAGGRQAECQEEAGEECLFVHSVLVFFVSGQSGCKDTERFVTSGLVRVVYLRLAAGGGFFFDVEPLDAGGDEGAGGDALVGGAAGFGDEADVCAAYLAGADFLGCVDSLPLHVGRVEEGSHAFQLDGAALGHVVCQDAAQLGEYGVDVAATQGGEAGELFGDFARGDGTAHGDALRVPLAVDGFLCFLVERHKLLFIRV